MTHTSPSIDAQGPDTAPAGARFARLHPLAPIGIRSEACLHLQKPYIGCRRCEDACPHACLKLDPAGLALEPTSCVGCGLCASACPTGALAADGFDLIGGEPGAALDIACRKMSEGEPRDHAGSPRRVPCLGGIGDDGWIALVHRAAGAPITVLDDGACNSCPTARGKGNPARTALARVERSLRGAGVAAERIPVLEDATRLPFRNIGEGGGARRSAAGRRAFFSGLGRTVSRGLAGRIGSATPPLDLADLPRSPRNAVPYHRGHVTRLTLEHLAATTSTPAVMREAWLAEVEVSAACCGHATCARVCPTGALRSASSDGQRILDFDAWQCIDCAACAKACPSYALRYAPPRWRAFETGRRQLSRIELRECARCGEGHAATGNDEHALCDHCAKTQNLSRAGFSLVSALRGIGPPAGP